MSDLKRRIFLLTGRHSLPSWRYILRKAKKYALQVPPVYLRSRLRKLTGLQPSYRDQPFLFICGLHRSGTSLIHRLLRAHPDISGIAHTTVPEDEGQHLQTVFESDGPYGPLFSYSPQLHLTEESNLVSTGNKEKLLREWGYYLNYNKGVLIEKSPSNIIRTRFLQAVIPSACFLIVARHPIATAMAVRKWTDAPLTKIIEHWLHAHQLLMADIGHLQRRLVVRYEDFVDSPEQCLVAVTDMLGLDTIGVTESTRNSNQAYFDAWEAEAEPSPDWVDHMLSTHASLLDTFGYSLSPPYVFRRAIPLDIHSHCGS